MSSSGVAADAGRLSVAEPASAKATSARIRVERRAVIIAEVLSGRFREMGCAA
jgi:hypothetical protein